ncbi:MAG: hypothetical protein IPJ32_14995 [Sphingobacteriaceae bacterium]|nr:hypothetical protein [Sphingobacteriaceae bacterium]
MFPEIVPFLLKNHISKIAYMNISLNEKDSQVSVGPMGGIPMGTVKTINFSDYYLDLDDPCYFTKHYIAKGGKTLFFSENIAAEIYTGVKIMAQENSAQNGK